MVFKDSKLKPTVDVQIADSNSSVNASTIQNAEDFDAAEMRKVLYAACIGTVIEWYDFFTFGTIATAVAGNFYDSKTEVGNFIYFLLTFAVGFMVKFLNFF